MDLSGEVERVLRKLDAGGRIDARRVFPFPHVFHVSTVDDAGEGAEVTLGTIDRLISAAYIRALPTQDKLGDRFSYVISDAGYRALTEKVKAAQSDQIVIPGCEGLLEQRKKRSA